MDFLIKNGTVYDPAHHKLYQGDVALHKGKIVKPEDSIEYRQVIDASGCIVTTGLIDFHVHYMLYGTENGVNPDANSFCCGITTAVDGGTCGAGGYELFHKSIVSMSQVRIVSDLLVASGGQSNDRYPENLDPKFFDEEKILQLFEQYPQLVGLKTRISSNIIEAGLAEKSLARTVEIGEKAGVPVIVHVTNCSIPLDRLASLLRPGDVICHIYHNIGKHTCLDEDGRVLEGLWEAKKRGVLFDACNGRSNYDLEVCQKAVAQGFVPDIISSDVNAASWFLQPLHSLPRILSKYLDFGMSIEQVLDAATIVPARRIGRPELGSMAEGTEGDICIFKLKKKPVSYSDINGNTYEGTQVLVPVMTFKAGRCVYCQADFC